jgi:hypothetical protein
MSAKSKKKSLPSTAEYSGKSFTYKAYKKIKNDDSTLVSELIEVMIDILMKVGDMPVGIEVNEPSWDIKNYRTDADKVIASIDSSWNEPWRPICIITVENEDEEKEDSE